MRFISRYGRPGVSIFKPTYELIATPGGGKARYESQPGFIAMFDRGGIREYEIVEAKKAFKFPGLFEKEDPVRRLSLFDTDTEAKRLGWDEEYKAKVEEILLSRCGPDIIMVEPPPVAVPWPNYPRIKNAEKIISRVKEDGYSPKLVLEYELQNEKRSEVIEAMKELLKEEILKEVEAAEQTSIEVEV